MRRLIVSGLFTLVAAVVVGLLPGPLTVTARAAEPAPACFLDTAGQVACPPVYAPARLVSPRVLSGVSPAMADALRAFEDQALDAVIADHALAASDRDTVLSYARDDVAAQMWALMVKALQTGAGGRTAQQQAVVDWYSAILTSQRQPGPKFAALEYAKFAGKDLQKLQLLLDGGASEGQIKDFLTGTPEPFNIPDENRATGGYCKYHPPAPFQDEYDGSILQSCFTPCQNAFGCAPPTPSYDEFVKWGNTKVGQFGSNLDSWLQQGMIANATVFGGLAAELGGAAIGAALVNVLDGTALATEIFPYAGAAVEWAATSTDAVLIQRAVAVSARAASVAATQVADQAFAVVVAQANEAATAAMEVAIQQLAPRTAQLVQLMVANSAAIGFGVGVAAAAIAIAVQVGINVANLDQMPAKLAAAIAQSRQPVDAAQYFASSGGPSALFAIFTDALSPTPRNDTSCDNNAVRQIWDNWANGRPFIVPQWQVDLGGFNYTPCLNPVAIPAARETDPHFVVTDAQTGTTTESPTITVEQLGAADVIQTLRVRGDNWFILRAADGSESESLRISYTDWIGKSNLAWLRRTAGGWRFYGIQEDAEGRMVQDPDDCRQCWSSDELKYVGPDGKNRRARIAPYQAPSGQPSFSAAVKEVNAPVTFDAGGFKPGGAVGPVTYQWRFQRDDCGIPCSTIAGPNFDQVAVFGDPVSGPTASYAWQLAGDFHVSLTATDSQGHQAVTQMIVPIASVAPRATLARDCAVTVVPVGCNNYPTQAGSPSQLFGGVRLTGTYHWANVMVDWGDGLGSVQQVGYRAVHNENPVSFTRGQDGQSYTMHATHTYAKAGLYTVTVTAKDRSGAATSASIVQAVKGPQQITFGQLPDRQYGQAFTATATGGPSGFPVTFTAGPADVCTADGGNGEEITPVGLGTCTVVAHQAGGGPIYGDAIPVQRAFKVTPASLQVTTRDSTKTYGAPDPEFKADFSGLRNGDTPEDLGELEFTGPPTDSPVGAYDVTASGASNPNYEISYTKGRLFITKAPLTITPDDQTRVYGSDKPAYTAGFDGLVNGDTAADITGLRLDGVAQSAHAGTYPITANFATNPNYSISYVPGHETITKAPLTVTADDVTRQYGRSANYSPRFDGLVNNDGDIPGLTFTGADKSADVGTYPITVTGHSDDYDITFVNGTEKITPAPLTIRVDAKTRTYGAPSPTYTAGFFGLVNGDTSDEITGLTLVGAQPRASVGDYLIKPSGATNPNYTISYVAAFETVTPTPLKITANDATKVYGAPDPAFTATYDGLVYGEPASVVTGLAFDAAPTGSDVGSYPIVPKGAYSPNYAISYANGTETVTPAALTIRAQDKTTKYGTVAAYTWKGDGWVNGDTDATIGTAPTCKATIQGAAASVTSNPGAYVGAITCAGAADPNYTVGYASAKLTVNPVIRLDQTGLPSTLPKRATIDGQIVTLPTGDVEVGYGTAHAYSFPAVVTDTNGVAYMTTTPALLGPIVTNRIVTATYVTMANALATAVASGGMDQKTANTLIPIWNDVQAGLKSGNVSKTKGAVTQFASAVRAQSGKKITKATADSLIAYAQLVYTSVGGTGTV